MTVAGHRNFKELENNMQQRENWATYNAAIVLFTRDKSSGQLTGTVYFNVREAVDAKDQVPETKDSELWFVQNEYGQQPLEFQDKKYWPPRELEIPESKDPREEKEND